MAFLDYESCLILYQNIRKIPQIKDIENFNDFFNYFEKTWFPIVNTKDKKKTKDSKYKFSLWNYNGKFEFKSTSGTLLAKNQLELYVAFSNNCCESLNSLIKNFAPLNKNVSIPLFKNIILSIFARTNAKSYRNNLSQDKVLQIKRTVSDELIDLMTFTDNKKIITVEDYNKFKHIADDEIYENYDSEDDNTELRTDNNSNLQSNEEAKLNTNKIDISEEDDNGLDIDL